VALNEQIGVDFAPGDAGAGLEITAHEVIDASGAVRPQPVPLADPHVLLRLYPAVWPSPLRATVGSVAQQGVRAEQIIDETVVFRGEATARTRRRPASGVQIHTDGLTFDVDGNTVAVSVTADANGNLRASQPFHGAALVTYTAEYRLLRYDYGIEALAGGGARITAGTVLAWHGGEVADFEVEPLQLGDSEPDTAVFFRDVSFTILQQSEEFERPPSWPDTTWGPGGTEIPVASAINPAPDPDEAWVEHERVHQIGRIDDACRVSLDTYFVTPAAPFVGTSNYAIPVERQFTSEQQLNDRGYSSACIARANQQMQSIE